jgi:hypothetical protein
VPRTQRPLGRSAPVAWTLQTFPPGVAAKPRVVFTDREEGLSNNRPVGLWMLPAHIGASRNLLAALQRDFARLRTLEHPHIARLLELGCNGKQYYVTGERLDGEPLREVLTHLLPERLDVGEADDVVRAVGSALVYAHEHGLAHGDVRAENVLVTMDRRFVLTNFLARRVAKVGSRPPRERDDLRGLARLAAELYTGSASPHALRGAVHGDVPAARLNAIRAVLDPASRRSSSIAQFLAAAGLAFADVDAAPPRRAEKPQRSWSIWRLVVPMAAVAAIGSLVASYHGGVGASAAELKGRGLDALRAVAERVAPPPAPTEPSRDTADLQHTAATEPEAVPTPFAADDGPPDRPAQDVPAQEPPAQDLPAQDLPPPDVQPAAATAPPAVIPVVATRSGPPRGEPPAISLGVPRIAAREDHSVVAIDVVRSGDTTQETTVGWWTTPDTAHAEEDYVDVGAQIARFPPGATVARVLIPIVNDGVRESDEVFTVHLSRPRGGAAGTVTATRVTLHDDD